MTSKKELVKIKGLSDNKVDKLFSDALKLNPLLEDVLAAALNAAAARLVTPEAMNAVLPTAC